MSELRLFFHRVRFKFRWGKRELIVPKDVLRKVQSSFGKVYSSKATQKNSIFANGWLSCADPACGCQVIFDPKIKVNKHTGQIRTFNYYHCTNGKRVHQTMKGMNVTEEKLWDQFGEVVGSISITNELAQELADALNEAHDKAKETTKKTMNTYRLRLKELENEEDDLYGDLKKNRIDDPQFQRLVKKVRTERAEYTDLLEQLTEGQSDAFRETAQSILELAIYSKRLWLSRSPIERRDFLDQLLSNPVLNGLNVEYTLKKPFAVLAEMGRESNWRPLFDQFVTAHFQEAA